MENTIEKILIRVPKKLKEYIWEKAKELGISANAYLLQLMWDDFNKNSDKRS